MKMYGGSFKSQHLCILFSNTQCSTISAVLILSERKQMRKKDW